MNLTPKIEKKTFAIMIITLLMLSVLTSMTLTPTVKAHTPPSNITTFAYVSATPNPVGINQPVSVVMWLDKLYPGATILNQLRFRNYQLTITAPDGEKTTMKWDIVTDTTSSQFTAFTPNQIGTYTFEFSFPGQVVTETDLILATVGTSNILVPSENPFTNDTFLPSKASTTLTVQEQQLPGYISYPLPTEYWTRPIEGQNNEWYTIASNWLGSPQIIGAYQPDGIAPNSAHIMWTKPISAGGVVGGSYEIDGITYYGGTAYEMRFNNPLIIDGKLYYTLPLSNAGAGGGYVCVDLQTGEKLWQQNYPTVIGGFSPAAISYGQIMDFEGRNQHGVIPNGYLWAVTGSTAKVYDALTGASAFNLTEVPAGTTIYGPNGEILKYVLNATRNGLALWNSTRIYDLGNAPDPRWDQYWRAAGKTANSSTGYSWNAAIPTLPTGTTIVYAITDDLALAGTPVSRSENNQIWGIDYTMSAISLKPESRGTLLWTKQYTAPEGNQSRSIAAVDPVNRVFIVFDQQSISYTGYSIDNGNKLWGPTISESSWNYYLSMGISRTAAYGKLFSTGYSGTVYCYDTADGRLLWNFTETSGFETPYPGYPITISAVADGKVYICSSEHSSGAPYWKGAQTWCLNATTGEIVWSITSNAGNSAYLNSLTNAMYTSAIADGYYVYLNMYDMQIYTIGKGPSALTVEAPKTSIELGKSLVISGTVTDIAAGTKQKEQAARFPNGVPAVSDESQSAWMEYVYMQKPKPTNTTGVDVTLSVTDANGNYREIGTTTTIDGTFALNWKPDIEGLYTVYASFAGTESYWPSHAVTSFAVDPAPATPAPQPTQPASLADQYILPGIIGIIAAIAIGFVASILILRKRP